MHVDFISVLPEMFAPLLSCGVVGRAANGGAFSWRVLPLRAFATGRHRITDLPPFGGGAGMVMKVEPLVRAIRWATHNGPRTPAPPVDAVDTPSPPHRLESPQTRVLLMDAGGEVFNQRVAQELATAVTHLVLVCGRYEGVDERVKAHTDGALCVGEAVFTGGELPALLVADAVVRLLPGALGNPQSTVEESHGEDGLLEYPQYTRPREFEGVVVPDVLMGGNHKQVATWRRQQQLVRTRSRSPQRFEALDLGADDQALLDVADGKPPARARRRR